VVFNTSMGHAGHALTAETTPAAAGE
jgi:hypothetical protein